MAHSLSAKKRIRQNAKLRARNRGRKAQIKSSIRQFNEALAAGDPAKTAEALTSAIKKIDQIAAKGTIHRNTASRRKSLLMRRLNAAKAAAK
ncbi:MAG: 30S ribosomal protein S20 [Planctomycetes bacterium]|nr:30S ribosomal protein S20 [Planctomycetota bacterium]